MDLGPNGGEPEPGCPQPAYSLTTTFMLSTKESTRAWVDCTPGELNTYIVAVGNLSPDDEARLSRGTRAGKAQDFVCVHTGAPVTRSYIRAEGKAGRLGAELLAIVVVGDGERLYLSPVTSAVPALTPAEAQAVNHSRKTFLAGATPTRAMTTGGVCSAYGLDSWGSLFTDRQICLLTTLADLIVEVQSRASESDRRSPKDPTLSTPYGDAIASLVALSISKVANLSSTLTTWMNDRGAFRETFARQALPMTWDFAESNPFSDAGGSLDTVLDKMAMAVAFAPGLPVGYAQQQSAQAVTFGNSIVCTDPPYYDNIAYADLSDFFYPWLRRALARIEPDLFSTIATPKEDELVATPHRHGSQVAADSFFLDGMTTVMRNMAGTSCPAYPVCLFYAFKQSDTDREAGTASTGWETFLEACLRAGLAVVGTWPMRTEGAGRLVAYGTNALASSIVLVCRHRATANPVPRREFLRELERALPHALAEMTADPMASVAPVDLHRPR